MVDGVVHYCVTNMPGAVPRTSTLGAVERDAAVRAGAGGSRAARRPRRDPALAKGVNVLNGKVTYQAVAEAFGLAYTPLAEPCWRSRGVGRA